MSKRRRKNPAAEFVDLGEVLRDMGIDVGGIVNKMFGLGQAEWHKPVSVSPIPPELFKKMLFLCHPDKHANHAHAVEVTKWLLEERKKSSR